jgi:hypothetical protein
MKGIALRRRHVFVLAAFALAAAAVVTASPASAQGNHAAKVAASADAFCNPLASNLFGLGGVSARGGEGFKEPTLNETYTTMPDSAKGKGGPTFRATIPVYFHVVSPDGVTANVTQRQIDEQITVLNFAFGGVYGGANTGFSFKLAGVTRTVNAAWYNAAPGSFAEREMKKSLGRGGLGALNYYSTTASFYLGWAYLPGLTPSRQYLDGIVVDWESMPGTSTRYAGKYDEGKTAVHEVGHWVNLEHTFYGGCNANGDYVDDTPAQKTPTSGCPVGQDSCPREPGLDPIHNYMDYSYDSCYFEFTPGQGARMQDAYLFYRA